MSHHRYTAKLSLHSPLSSDTHSPLSILKNAIAVETTTQGVYLLWTRYSYREGLEQRGGGAVSFSFVHHYYITTHSFLIRPLADIT